MKKWPKLNLLRKMKEDTFLHSELSKAHQLRTHFIATKHTQSIPSLQNVVIHALVLQQLLRVIDWEQTIPFLFSALVCLQWMGMILKI